MSCLAHKPQPVNKQTNEQDDHVDFVETLLLVRFYNFCVFVYVFTFVFWIVMLFMSVMCCLWRDKE